MSRLIIYVTGKPSLHGHKRREFHWSPAHGLYLYGGKEIEAGEFNIAFEKAMKTNADMNPRVKVVDVGVIEVVHSAKITTVPGEITVDEAEAVLQRLVPHRLKKKTGPKSQERTLEVA